MTAILYKRRLMHNAEAGMPILAPMSNLVAAGPLVKTTLAKASAITHRCHTIRVQHLKRCYARWWSSRIGWDMRWLPISYRRKCLHSMLVGAMGREWEQGGNPRKRQRGWEDTLDSRYSSLQLEYLVLSSATETKKVLGNKWIVGSDSHL